MIFFYLSKILEFFLSPFLWLGILLLISLLLKNKVKAKKLLWLTFILYFLFGNLFIADEIMRWWEKPVTRVSDLAQVYDAGIVLGGGMVQEDRQNNRLIFRNNTDRILQALSLYKAGRIRKILLSGGSGDFRLRDMKEGPLLKKYLVSIGIPATDILVDSLSDNTRQNAVYSAQILKRELPDGRYLLITSAFHMRRAVACYRKVGLNCDFFTTNKNVGKRVFTAEHLLLPNIGGLIFYQSLFHECVGFLVYLIMGYI
ncbi:MAG: YdcF family protein [Bacteroidetes bacterium]|nr:YdcF family protein [Bacteroidota bacterium]